MTYGFFSDSPAFRQNLIYWHFPELANMAGIPGMGKTVEMAESYFVSASVVLADELVIQQCLNN